MAGRQRMGQVMSNSRRLPLSVIIPVLNAEGCLDRTLSCLRADSAMLEIDVVVADGGSTDSSRAIAAAQGVRLLRAPRGRGSQLAAGAAAARSAWLLFLHADTVPEPGWDVAVQAFARDAANRERAGYFRFALEDEAPAARRLERLVAWRCRRLGLPYGDQGLLIHRDLYNAIGGFEPIPLMEDIAIVRRLGARRLVELPAGLRTSAARYRQEGYILRPLRNLACLALYRLGVPPRKIARLYG